MKIVSWQNVLTDHQAHTFRELQNLVDRTIDIIVGVDELGERVKQGWDRPNKVGLSVRCLPAVGWLREGRRLLIANQTAVHIFVGLWADRRFLVLILYAVLRGMKVGLITEPYSESAHGLLSDEVWWKSRMKLLMRPLLYRIAGAVLGKRVKPFFAVSQKAREQFLQLGFDDSNIFNFGYFVPRLTSIRCSEAKPGPDGLNIVFVGALISRKGIHDAIDAVALCAGRGIDVYLDLYGPGDIRFWTEKLNERIRYRGKIPFGKTQSVIVDYDLLLLPSRYDGWGVVVNEALLQGVPAVVSDSVGAADIVSNSGAGAVFETGNIHELARLLESIVQNPGKLSAWRKKAEVFGDKLLPEVAAQYMYDCLEFCVEGRSRPKYPWH